jgi:hypothetical protein
VPVVGIKQINAQNLKGKDYEITLSVDGRIILKQTFKK